MDQPSRTPSVSAEPPLPAPPRLRSLLVPVDLTAASDRILGRVALLPLAADARVTLLHVVPDDLPAAEQRSVEREATKTLAEEARQLARALPETVHVAVVVRAGTPPKAIAAQAHAVDAELVVMGRGGGRVLRDLFLGSTAERVLRRGQRPVLVVRRPARAPYDRPLLAVDLDPAAHALLPLALRMLPPPRPSLDVVHAYTTPYHGLVHPGLADDDESRRALEEQTSEELSRLLLDALAEARLPPGDVPLWKLHVRHGAARPVIEKAAKKADADLLVLGTHGHSGLAHALLGTVAGDVLRDVTCDVLVVPPALDASETRDDALA